MPVVTKVTPVRTIYMTITGTSWEPWKEFRRSFSSNHWEVAMGMSWEEVGDSDELEKAYQAYLEEAI